eukprot:CAMPEP_0113489774 /NCGR_PEP_ID=MMETSP0014_2-20120614/26702_1 /TAXON_ID=2857 /ORGANISM="Nitzschia sp." /LENGTH=239 /DNA_ID=CAMNT_0000383521 /DNA_START=102 /DNA_END=821 /DNA_ORIENTATION=+ /assembly_acc=CAM_ASM_000159
MAPPAATATAASTVTATTEATPMTQNKPLETVEWVLWQHHLPRHVRNDDEWMNDTSEVAHFFAHHMSAPYNADLGHLPLPSQHFFLKNERGEKIEAPKTHLEYSLFKAGTKPTWCDTHCKGELYTKHYFPAELLDKYWHALVGGVMDGKVDDGHIVALRVVDKSHGKHPMYKLEIWIDDSENQKVRDKIRSQAMSCIPEIDEHHKFKFHWRDFSATPSKNDTVSNESGSVATTSSSAAE